jgi:hypothetical protein
MAALSASEMGAGPCGLQAARALAVATTHMLNRIVPIMSSW